VQKKLQIWQAITAEKIFKNTVFGICCLEAFLSNTIINEVSNKAAFLKLVDLQVYAAEWE